MKFELSFVHVQRSISLIFIKMKGENWKIIEEGSTYPKICLYILLDQVSHIPQSKDLNRLDKENQIEY